MILPVLESAISPRWESVMGWGTEGDKQGAGSTQPPVLYEGEFTGPPESPLPMSL